MAETLFTEGQWRAIVWVEDESWSYRWLTTKADAKRVFAASFPDGEYYTAIDRDYFPADRFGPADVSFILYERTSGLVFSSTSRSHAGAIAEARETMRLIGPEYLVGMFADYRDEPRAQMLAEFDAREAIAKAKAEKKAAPKKVGRRRRAIFDESNGRCHYCEAALTLTGDWHVEHKMPKALGGTDDPINLVAACAPCNREKHDKTDVEYFALLAARGQAAQPAQASERC